MLLLCLNISCVYSDNCGIGNGFSIAEGRMGDKGNKNSGKIVRTNRVANKLLIV